MWSGERQLPAVFISSATSLRTHLPVAILDHKGKIAINEYSIVNPVVLQHALDVKASQARYRPLVKTEIASVNTLVIDPARVDPEGARHLD